MGRLRPNALNSGSLLLVEELVYLCGGFGARVEFPDEPTINGNGADARYFSNILNGYVFLDALATNAYARLFDVGSFVSLYGG